MQSSSFEHLTSQQVAGFRERTIPPEEQLALDAHLAACDSCRHLLRPHGSGKTSLLQFEEGLLASEDGVEMHLTYEEMTAYLDGKADPVTREIVEGHADVCRQCQQELEEMRQTQNSLLLGSRGVLELSPRPSFIQKVIQSVRSARWHLAAEMALVAALLLLFLYKPSLPTQTGVTPPQNSELIEDLRNLVKKGEADTATLSKQRDDEKAKRLEAEKKVASLTMLNRKPRYFLMTRQGQTRTEKSSEAVLIQDALKKGLEVASLLPVENNRTMGASNEEAALRLLFPVNTNVKELQPLFQWKSRGRGAIYDIFIIRKDGSDALVLEHKGIIATQWRPEKPLPQGQVLQWQVVEHRKDERDDSPLLSERANFRVLDAASIRELAQAEREAVLAQGIRLAKKGLVKEAEAQFRAVLAKNPTDAVAAGFLQTIRRQQPSTP